MNKKIVLLIKVALSLTIIFCCSFAQNNFVKENYEKQEYRIKMRDGITLYTSVYIPKDQSQKYPILLTRTPYSCQPYGKDNYAKSIVPNHNLEKEKFIFVKQDVRGRFMSEGEYDNMKAVVSVKNPDAIDELTDTYDTIEWLVDNLPNNNGKVGMWGISYPGFYAALGAICGHPAMVATSPQAPIADWYIGDDMHHNGALTLPMVFNFFSAFGVKRTELTTEWTFRPELPNVDQYNFFLNMGSLKNINKDYYKGEIAFWNEVVKHPNYDEFWKSRNTLLHFHNVKPAVMVVGGWFDGEDLYGALKTYASIEDKNKENKNILVMGPWPHGGWSRNEIDHFGDIKYPINTSDFYRDELELEFFNYYLKGKGEFNLPEVSMFNTGTNEFSSFDKWPPIKSKQKTFYLKSSEKIQLKNNESEVNFVEYISDPANPVPYTADFVRSSRFYNKTYLNEDQRFASTRPDVIEFSKKVDKEFTLSGEIEVELYVSTTGTDADWVVKLIDVFPDNYEGETDNNIPMGGYQMLLRGEIMRGKYRNSFEKPEPFTPGKIEKVKFKLQDVFHTFKKGHKMMVQVQSSWFPLFDRNPQQFLDIYNADEKDYKKAVHKVYISKKHPSNIKINVFEK